MGWALFNHEHLQGRSLAVVLRVGHDAGLAAGEHCLADTQSLLSAGLSGLMLMKNNNLMIILSSSLPGRWLQACTKPSPRSLGSTLPGSQLFPAQEK